MSASIDFADELIIKLLDARRTSWEKCLSLKWVTVHAALKAFSSVTGEIDDIIGMQK